MFKPSYITSEIFSELQFLHLQSRRDSLPQAVFVKLTAKGLAQCCPIELSAKMEISNICSVPYRPTWLLSTCNI